MTQKAQQLELRWITPAGRLNPRFFRQCVGFQLGKADPEQDWAWLFNRYQNGTTGLATIRFYTAEARGHGVAGIIAAGDEACQRLGAIVPILLPAVREIEGFSGHPTIHTDSIYWERIPYAMPYRANTIVLPKLRGDQAYYDMHRAQPELLIPYVREAVVDGINRMAGRINLASPELSADQVDILEIGPLGSQPIHKPGGEAMLSRMTHAIFQMPLKLQGDWRVGGLLSYGNGRVTSLAAERHYRAGRASPPATRPFPTYRMAG